MTESDPVATDSPDELTLNEQIGYYVDMWKKSVEVQQHFNEIEWRIRGLALTVATFALGAAGLSARSGTKVGFISLGSLVIIVALVLWYAFYFVDRAWYHPLLKAAVEHGTEFENEIKKSLPKAGMTASITAGSAYTTGSIVRCLSRRSTMHSDHKLVWFYSVGAFAMVVAAIALQTGATLADTDSPDVPQRSQIDAPTGQPVVPHPSAPEPPPDPFSVPVP